MRPQWLQTALVHGLIGLLARHFWNLGPRSSHVHKSITTTAAQLPGASDCSVKKTRRPERERERDIYIYIYIYIYEVGLRSGTHRIGRLRLQCGSIDLLCLFNKSGCRRAAPQSRQFPRMPISRVTQHSKARGVLVRQPLPDKLPPSRCRTR